MKSSPTGLFSGANPLWDPDTEPVAPRTGYLTDLDLRNGKLNRRDADDDAGSTSSGDSVLIGVENQAEFRGYRERVSFLVTMDTIVTIG